MPKQLSSCCKAEINLTGEDRPNAFDCSKCHRIIGIEKPYIEQVLEEFREKFPNSNNAVMLFLLRNDLEKFLKDTIIKFAFEVESKVIGADSDPYYAPKGMKKPTEPNKYIENDNELRKIQRTELLKLIGKKK